MSRIATSWAWVRAVPHAAQLSADGRTYTPGAGSRRPNEATSRGLAASTFECRTQPRDPSRTTARTDRGPRADRPAWRSLPRLRIDFVLVSRPPPRRGPESPHPEEVGLGAGRGRAATIQEFDEDGPCPAVSDEDRETLSSAPPNADATCNRRNSKSRGIEPSVAETESSTAGGRRPRPGGGRGRGPHHARLEAELHKDEREVVFVVVVISTTAVSGTPSVLSALSPTPLGRPACPSRRPRRRNHRAERRPAVVVVGVVPVRTAARPEALRRLLPFPAGLSHRTTVPRTVRRGPVPRLVSVSSREAGTASR